MELQFGVTCLAGESHRYVPRPESVGYERSVRRGSFVVTSFKLCCGLVALGELRLGTDPTVTDSIIALT